MESGFASSRRFRWRTAAMKPFFDTITAVSQFDNSRVVNPWEFNRCLVQGIPALYYVITKVIIDESTISQNTNLIHS